MLHLPTLPTRSWRSVRVRGLLRHPVLFSTVLDCTVPFRSVLFCSVFFCWNERPCALFQAVLTFQTYLLLYQDAIFVSWRHQYLFQRPPAIQKPLKWQSIYIHVQVSLPVRSSRNSIISVPAMELRSADLQLFLFSPCILAHASSPSSNKPNIFAVSCPCCHIISASVAYAILVYCICCTLLFSSKHRYCSVPTVVKTLQFQFLSFPFQLPQFNSV